MRVIQKYVADDGEEFYKECDAIAYESIIGKINSVMQTLKPTPNIDKFYNEGGYVQQNRVVVIEARKALSEIINQYFDLVGVSLDGNLPEVINKAVIRLDCIDVLGREYGQLFFRTHPNQASNIEYA